jgi:hypothetical protein
MSCEVLFSLSGMRAGCGSNDCVNSLRKSVLNLESLITSGGLRELTTDTCQSAELCDLSSGICEFAIG